MPYKNLEKRKAYNAAYSKQWRIDNIEKCREKTRKSMEKWRTENPELALQYQREWRKKNKKKELAYVSRYKKNNPEKAKAHRIVFRAVKKGVLVRQPCEVCGNQKSQGHHEDYSKPLSIVWLCQKHHKDRHKKPAGNGL